MKHNSHFPEGGIGRIYASMGEIVQRPFVGGRKIYGGGIGESRQVPVGI